MKICEYAGVIQVGGREESGGRVERGTCAAADGAFDLDDTECGEVPDNGARED
jgi:hypothetical protein